MKKILLIIVAGLLVSCGLTKKETENQAETRNMVAVPIEVDYAEKMGLALLLADDNLPHVIEISGCISFNAGEKKTVQYLNINDNQVSTAVALPEKLDGTVTGGNGTNNNAVQGSIELFEGDTGCAAELVRFRQDGQWYEKSASDQPPVNTGMILYRAIDVPAKDSKEYWVQNLSDLDQIHDVATLLDNQIKFAVWKSFERNQVERSINVQGEWSTNTSQLEDRNLGKFDITGIAQTYNVQLRMEQILLTIACSGHEQMGTFNENAIVGFPVGTPMKVSAAAGDIYCNDSDVDATDSATEDTRFHLFSRDASKKTYTIQEIIDTVANTTLGHNGELLPGASIKGAVAENSGTPLALPGGGNVGAAASFAAGARAVDNWTATFNFPNSLLFEGSNALVLVVEHLDPYAPNDLYSSSYRYHLVRMDYHTDIGN